MSQRAVLWCRSEMGNKEDLAQQNQDLSFYCKERGMRSIRTILEYGKANILKLRNFRQMANNLLNKCPTSTALDKQYINRLLWWTYLLVFAVMLVFVICHGLEFYEQIITALIFGVLYRLSYPKLFKKF